jgi:hypothetical protein
MAFYLVPVIKIFWVGFHVSPKSVIKNTLPPCQPFPDGEKNSLYHIDKQRKAVEKVDQSPPHQQAEEPADQKGGQGVEKIWHDDEFWRLK